MIHAHDKATPSRRRTACAALAAALLLGALLAVAGAPFAAASAAAPQSKNAQTDEAKQRKIIADIERSIAEGEKQLSTLKKDKQSASKRVKLLNRQIEQRNAVITSTNNKMKQIAGKIAESNQVARQLETRLELLEDANRSALRAAYRNYRMHNITVYLLSSDSFSEIARRIASLRAAADRNVRRMHEIQELRTKIAHEREVLDAEHKALADTKSKLDRERDAMRSNVKSLKEDVNRLSRKEKKIISTQMERSAQLDRELKRLRQMTKGNRVGDKFSRSTRGLNIPLAGGRAKRYDKDMAEFVGARGAAVRSVFDGKILDVKRNSMNNKFEIYIAHGEYITFYSGLATASVSAGQSVTRNQTIGTAGDVMDVLTQKVEGRIRFIIASPNGTETLSAASFFK